MTSYAGGGGGAHETPEKWLEYRFINNLWGHRERWLGECASIALHFLYSVNNSDNNSFNNKYKFTTKPMTRISVLPHFTCP